MSSSITTFYSWIVTFAVLPIFISAKYNQRLFVDVNPSAISFADPLKTGFRVILSDQFIQSQLASQNLPTLFVTAIPLNTDEQRHTQVIYPDTVHVDKQVTIHGLREQSWYYVCIEWESLNRHNETTGLECRLYQTLDRIGKTTDTVVRDLELLPLLSDRSLAFRMKTDALFPMRLTAYLKGGLYTPAAQTFHLTEPASVDIVFGWLRTDTMYGQLCIVEEPLVHAYTAMGRHVYGLSTHKCYFDQLSTQPSHVISEEADLNSNDIRAYRRVMDSAAAADRSPLVSFSRLTLSLLVIIFVSNYSS